MKYKPPDDSIEFSYHGRVYTISADRCWKGQSWQFFCHQLGLVSGSYATAQDALVAGVALVVQGGSGGSTRLVDLVA